MSEPNLATVTSRTFKRQRTWIVTGLKIALKLPEKHWKIHIANWSLSKCYAAQRPFRSSRFCFPRPNSVGWPWIFAINESESLASFSLFREVNGYDDRECKYYNKWTSHYKYWNDTLIVLIFWLCWAEPLLLSSNLKCGVSRTNLSNEPRTIEWRTLTLNSTELIIEKLQYSPPIPIDHGGENPIPSHSRSIIRHWSVDEIQAYNLMTMVLTGREE